jgi:succinate dehydrogenase/fumarate reductase flavoprotein subunit
MLSLRGIRPKGFRVNVVAAISLSGLSSHCRLRQNYSCGTDSSSPRPRDTDRGFDEETDVLIVGSGGAGLAAALRCHELSLDTILLEKSEKVGGTTALSGGGMWIPNNIFSHSRGDDDTFDKALNYLNLCIGEVGPASSKARRMAFLENAPRMLDFLLGCGFEGRPSGRYPNYYPHLEDGQTPRCVESNAFNARKLGPWYAKVRQGSQPYPPVYTDECPRLFRAATSLPNIVFAIRKLFFRGLLRKMTGERLVTMGPALVCQLLYLNLQRKLSLWLQSSLEDLVIENGKVVGAVVSRERGIKKRIRARRGVLLTAGGFSRNLEMRDSYQDHPASVAWTSAQEQDLGDAIKIGINHGAQVALMDDAWWGPTVVDPSTGQRFFMIFERALPHCIIVDSSGKRFMNEAQSYTDAGQAMYKRNREVSAIPAWIVLDTNHRRKYPLASMIPGYTPRSAIDSGFVFRGKTLNHLAKQIGIDADSLAKTVERFNTMARRGKDDDFGRGENEYDRFFADDGIEPNGNLAPIERAPFYAIKVWPGDLGTKGGLLTDENACVIDTNGKPIEGLYAAGNTSASVMGRVYPGPGSTLAPALTFSYIAINHIASMRS